METTAIEQKIEDALNEIRPYLQSDGGDVSFVEINENNEVTVKLMGACGACPMSMQTFKLGIEHSIKNKIPNVTKVFAVDETMNHMF